MILLRRALVETARPIRVIGRLLLVVVVTVVLVLTGLLHRFASELVYLLTELDASRGAHPGRLVYAPARHVLTWIAVAHTALARLAGAMRHPLLTLETISARLDTSLERVRAGLLS